MEIGNLGRYFNTYDITVNFKFTLFNFHWILPDCWIIFVLTADFNFKLVFFLMFFLDGFVFCDEFGD